MNATRPDSASPGRILDMAGRWVGNLMCRPAPGLPGRREWLVTDGVYFRVLGTDITRRAALERLDGLVRRAVRRGRRVSPLNVWWNEGARI